MSSGKYATFTPGFDRYTSVVDRYTPGVIHYGSRADRVTPPDMEMANSCRYLLLSRLRAAEILNKQLSDDARVINRLRTVHPPGKYNVDLEIEQVRAQMLDLIEMDIKVIRQLLNVSEQMEEIRWQRNFGEGSPCTPSIDMSLADIESVDLDLDMDYLASCKNQPRFRDDVINGDDADDVFQNDDTGRSSAKANNSAIQSNELRLTLTRSGNGVMVNSSDDNNGSSKVKLSHDSNSKTTTGVSKLTKVEFQVSGTQEMENKRPGVTVKGHGDLPDKEHIETAKVELRIAGKKDVEPITVASPSLQFRLVLQPNNDRGSRRPDELSNQFLGAHSNGQLTGAATFTSRGVNGTPSNLNRTSLQAVKPHGSHLGQGYRPIQAEEATKPADRGSKTPISIVTHL